MLRPSFVDNRVSCEDSAPVFLSVPSTASVLATSVSEVSGLWKLVGIVTLLLLALLFRGQISGLLDRGFKLRHRDTEFEAPPQPAPSVAQGEEAEPEPETDREEDGQSAIVPSASDEPSSVSEEEQEASMGRVFTAIAGGKVAEAETLFASIQSAEDDEVQRLRNKVMFAAARFRFGGDSDARRDLEELTEDRRVAAFAWNSLGLAYEASGHFDKALEAFDAGATAPEADDGARIASVVGAASSLHGLGRLAEGIARIREAIRDTTTPDLRRRLYTALADMYEKEEEWLSRALALEKALEANPYDASLRFRAGYSYSQAGG
jgi:tetratricopeptide (TPR) repeat protein